MNGWSGGRKEETKGEKTKHLPLDLTLGLRQTQGCPDLTLSLDTHTHPRTKTRHKKTCPQFSYL